MGMPLLKVGGLVSLKDQQSLEDAAKESGSMPSSVDVEIKEVRYFNEQQGNVRYALVELNVDNLYLLFKEDNQGEWYAILGFVPKELEGVFPANRKDLIDVGHHWLFNQPESEEWEPKDLDFVDEIYYDDGDGEATYNRLHEPVYGETNDQHLFGIVHWRATSGVGPKPPVNPDLVMVEYGQLDEPEGGVCLFLNGVVLGDNELEIWK